MRRPPRPAFSLTSLLFLVALLLLVLALLFPALAQARRAAARTQSVNNLRQMGIGMHAYHDVNKSLPAAVGKQGTAHFRMLPYIEQEQTYRESEGDWTRLSSVVVDLYLDSRDDNSGRPVRGFAPTNYAVNWKVTGDGGIRLVAIADGSSNTIMITQRFQACNGAPTAWAYNRLHYWTPMYGFYSSARFQVMPWAEQCDPALPQALEPAGILTCFADAAVRVASPHCSPQSWLAATEPADGLTRGDDF